MVSYDVILTIASICFGHALASLQRRQSLGMDSVTCKKANTALYEMETVISSQSNKQLHFLTPFNQVEGILLSYYIQKNVVDL